MEYNIDSNKLHFFLCVPRHFWRRIYACKESKIKILKKILKENAYTFIYKGYIVDPESTFKEIGILDGTFIVAIKKSSSKINDEAIKWMKLSNDTYYENKLQIYSDKKLKREQNRIRDIHYMKMEGNIKIYKRQLHNSYLKKLNENDEQFENDLNINYQPLLMPSTEAMPILW